MWSPQVTVYYTAPVVVTAVGVYLLYRATQIEGAPADRAFVIGIVLVLASWGFTATRSSHRHAHWRTQLESENQYLCRQVRELRDEVTEVRSTLDSKLAAEVFLAAMDRADAHRGKTWPRLHHVE